MKKLRLKEVPVGLIIGLVLLLGCAQANKTDVGKSENTEVKPVQIQEERITELIKHLGDNDWKKREQATDELFNISNPALPFLEETFKNTTDAEIRMRANVLIKGITIKSVVADKTLKHLPEELTVVLEYFEPDICLNLILLLGELPKEAQSGSKSP